MIVFQYDQTLGEIRQNTEPDVKILTHFSPGKQGAGNKYNYNFHETIFLQARKELSTRPWSDSWSREEGTRATSPAR